MKKIVVFVFISIVVAVILITSAFLYFYLNRHKTYLYDLYRNDKLWGTSKIDRYNTEDKIIFKSELSLPYTSGFPQRNEKYFVKKTTLELLKFSLEFTGVYGQKETILIEKEGDKASYLFLRHPEFLKIKDSEIEVTDTVFFPESLVSHMAVLEKYNFWKKGVQYIETAVPVDGPLPPLRVRIEVRHLGNQYISIMGRKIEAEILSFNSPNFPQTKVFVSKYSHAILMFNIHGMRTRWILKNAEEGSDRLLKLVRKKIMTVLSEWHLSFSKRRAPGIDTGKTKIPQPEPKTVDYPGIEKTEVFFESSNLVLSGDLYRPDGPGPFPGVIIIPRDGPIENGEAEMCRSLCQFLSGSGYMCLFFRNPGQGTSQGVFSQLNDEKHIDNITAAYKYLLTLSYTDDASMILIGHEGGGYLALKAASKISPSIGCIVINPSIFLNDEETAQRTVNAITAENRIYGLSSEEMKQKEKEFIENAETVMSYGNNLSYFLGYELPYEGYKQFLDRDVFKQLEMSENMTLLITGKDDPYFSQMNLDSLRTAANASGEKLKLSVFRTLGEFMGAVKYRENKWGFDLQKDAFESIRNWMTEEFLPLSEKMPQDINMAANKSKEAVVEQEQSGEVL